MPLSCSILTDLADRLVASVTQAGSAGTSPHLYRTLVRLLVRGEPVGVAELATEVGWSIHELETAIAGWSDTEYDEWGRIIGWGVTLRPTPHRFVVDGKQLYTWCALDTLFLPAVIGRPARVESPCHATGTPIRLDVDPIAGVKSLDPATAVVSIITPENMASVRGSFCNPGRFFVTADAARDWQVENPGMRVLPVADAHRLSGVLSDMLLGLLCGPTEKPSE